MGFSKKIDGNENNSKISIMKSAAGPVDDSVMLKLDHDSISLPKP